MALGRSTYSPPKFLAKSFAVWEILWEVSITIVFNLFDTNSFETWELSSKALILPFSPSKSILAFPSVKIILTGEKPLSRLDGRTRAYKLHAQRLQAQRERRQKLKDSKSNKFTKGLKEKFSDFSREEFIVEDNVAILRDIVKRKQAKPIKLKDGQMKIDLNSASAIIKNLVDAPKNFMKDDTRKKVLNIINKGRKDQFLRLIDMLYK